MKNTDGYLTEKYPPLSPQPTQLPLPSTDSTPSPLNRLNCFRHEHHHRCHMEKTHHYLHHHRHHHHHYNWEQNYHNEYIIIIIIIINAINIPITMAIIIVVLVVEYYTKQKDRRLKSVFTRHYCYIFRVVLWLCLLQRQWDVEINFCMGYAQSNQHIIMNILVLLIKTFRFCDFHTFDLSNKY